jgi:hypothetical protein
MPTIEKLMINTRMIFVCWSNFDEAEVENFARDMGLSLISARSRQKQSLLRGYPTSFIVDAEDRSCRISARMSEEG